ncbi:acyl-CoA-like ligand-binding transcription factor, partial [Nonomuraea sp. NPDC004297]
RLGRQLGQQGHRLHARRAVRRTPSLRPHELAVLAAQEKALAGAITERLSPAPAGIYPDLCAATALTALRVVLSRWLEHAGGPDETPPMTILRAEFDQAIAALAAGLDRPGTADPADPDREAGSGQ